MPKQVLIIISSESRYKEPRWNGAKYVMSPSLRTRESNFALWEVLRGGDPKTKFTITQKKLHMNVDCTPYEEMN